MQAIIGSLGIVVGIGLAVAAMRPTPDNPPVIVEQKKAESLEGGYTIVSGERDGKAIPAEEIKGAMIRFTDSKIVGTDKDRKEFFAATYAVDTTKKPWKIDMKTVMPAKSDPNNPKDALTATGLIKKEGETLTIIYALPGGDAPTEFKAKEKQQMFVLKSSADTEPNKFPPANPAIPPE